MSLSALATRIVHFHGTLVRNIKSIHAPQDLFDDLAEDAEEVEVAVAAESAHRISADTPRLDRPFDYGTVITHAFDTSAWLATRFSDGTRYGVWYGSLDLKTTVYETVHHWYAFVRASFPNENRVVVSERRVFDVRCDALLVDLRGAESDHPGLVDRGSYELCQRLGHFLHDQRSNGVLVRSARCDGVNAAIFRRDRLSQVRDKCQLTYRCHVQEDRVLIERTPGRTWLRIAPSHVA